MNNVTAMLRLEGLHVVSLAPFAGLADDGENRGADIGKSERAIAGHDPGESIAERRGNTRGLAPLRFSPCLCPVVASQTSFIDHR